MLHIDFDTRIIIRGKKAVFLNETEFRLFNILLNEYPGFLSGPTLWERLYGHRLDGGPSATSSLSVQIHHLLAKLDHLDMNIVPECAKMRSRKWRIVFKRGKRARHFKPRYKG